VTLSEGTLLSDEWTTKLTVEAVLSEGSFASELFTIPLSTDAGLIVATIRIAAAVSGSVDLNRHYND
jgi:hypothetical protein